MEMALLTLPEHLSSPPLFSGIHIAQSLDLYVVVFLRLWYLETFLKGWMLVVADRIYISMDVSRNGQNLHFDGC
jgi:hypothetical protein